MNDAKTHHKNAMPCHYLRAVLRVNACILKKSTVKYPSPLPRAPPPLPHSLFLPPTKLGVGPSAPHSPLDVPYSPLILLTLVGKGYTGPIQPDGDPAASTFRSDNNSTTSSIGHNHTSWASLKGARLVSRPRGAQFCKLCHEILT